jgi:hypothetical protein
VVPDASEKVMRAERRQRGSCGAVGRGENRKHMVMDMVKGKGRTEKDERGWKGVDIEVRGKRWRN